MILKIKFKPIDFFSQFSEEDLDKAYNDFVISFLRNSIVCGVPDGKGPYAFQNYVYAARNYWENDELIAEIELNDGSGHFETELIEGHLL